MKVKDVMTKDVISFDPDDTIYEVTTTLKEKNISGAPVVSDNKVVGIVTEADIMELYEEEARGPVDVWELSLKVKEELDRALRNIKKDASTKVKEIMTKKVETINPETEVSEAAYIMSEKQINRLPVVDQEGKLVGIISRADIIRAVAKSFQ